MNSTLIQTDIPALFPSPKLDSSTSCVPLQVLETEEHLRRVMQGRHALLTWKFYIQSLVASRYTDASGYSPLYIGRSQHFVSTGYGWGFRSGCEGQRCVMRVGHDVIFSLLKEFSQK